MCVHRGHSPDKRNRFGLKFSDGEIGANCFNCSFHARWSHGHSLSKDFELFLSTIGVPEEDIKRIKFQIFKEKEMSDNGIKIPASVIESTSVFAKWVKVDLPVGAETIESLAIKNCEDEDFLQVCRYIDERGLHSFDKLYWTPSKLSQMNKRVIIPCYFRGEIVGYIARYGGTPGNKLVPKYLNFIPEDYIYNIDKYIDDDSKTLCVLCEGVIDAFLVNGISCIGNSINQKQINIINGFKKQVIVCPDRDRSGEILIDIATREKWMVSFPKWDPEIKDPADAVKKYGRILTLRTIIDSSEHNGLKIHVSRKLDNYKEIEK